MARKKGSRNKVKKVEPEAKPITQQEEQPEDTMINAWATSGTEARKAEQPEEKPEVKDNSGLEDRPYFSIDEAARFLGVDDKCARLWFDHGHLAGIDDRGYIRVSRGSILRVKVSKLIVGPML